jgi:hypothetical protein
LPCFGLLCPGVCFASAEEEFYLDLLPWQWLAASNQNFLITERRRHYLRYAGALTFFEINGPSVYKVRSMCCQQAGADMHGMNTIVLVFKAKLA